MTRVSHRKTRQMLGPLLALCALLLIGATSAGNTAYAAGTAFTDSPPTACLYAMVNVHSRVVQNRLPLADARGKLPKWQCSPCVCNESK